MILFARTFPAYLAVSFLGVFDLAERDAVRALVAPILHALGIPDDPTADDVWIQLEGASDEALAELTRRCREVGVDVEEAVVAQEFSSMRNAARNVVS